MMCLAYGLFFFKQKTAYEMRISDWSSDVCSSDLAVTEEQARLAGPRLAHAPDQRGHALHIEGEAGHIAHRAVRLAMAHMVDGIDGVARRGQPRRDRTVSAGVLGIALGEQHHRLRVAGRPPAGDREGRALEIGRASCRERVWESV